MVVFQGAEDAHLDPHVFWGRVAGAVEVRRVEGGRETMLRPPAVESLAREFQDVLKRYRPGAAGGAGERQRSNGVIIKTSAKRNV